MPVPTHRSDCETQIWRWSCPDCGKPIWYFSCSCGSKVFFDTKGPEWVPHADNCPIYQVRILLERGIKPDAIRKMLYDRVLSILDEVLFEQVLRYLDRLESDFSKNRPIIKEIVPGNEPVETFGIVHSINPVNFFKRLGYSDNPITRSVLGEFAQIPYREVILRSEQDLSKLITSQYVFYIPEREIIDPPLRVGMKIYAKLRAQSLVQDENIYVWICEDIDWD